MLQSDSSSDQGGQMHTPALHMCKGTISGRRQKSEATLGGITDSDITPRYSAIRLIGPAQLSMLSFAGV